MSPYRVISSDSHVVEPPDLWKTRIESRFRGREPNIVSEEDGDWWYCDGLKLATGFGFGGAQAGKRFNDPMGMTVGDTFENVRPGGYIPDEHLKDMDIDGVDVDIIYPTLGLQLYNVPDSELLSAVFRAYNDWLGEFCGTAPKRMSGIAMLNVDDVQDAVSELKRCSKMGFAGAMITVYPPVGKRYDQPEYEPLWGTAEELAMPLGLHAATNRHGSGEGDSATRTLSISVNFDHYTRMSLCQIIYSGVFERHPRLQIGSVEHEVAWAAHFLERLDYNYSQRAPGVRGLRFKDDVLPSDFFRNNVFIGFQEDALGMQLRDYIGVDTLQWGSDYPHQESTFPRSREILEEILSDCTEEERAKIAGGNAARVYGV